jgi:hypothetical protein
MNNLLVVEGLRMTYGGRDRRGRGWRGRALLGHDRGALAVSLVLRGKGRVLTGRGPGRYEPGPPTRNTRSCRASVA